MLYLGSHVSCKGKEMLIGSVNDALANGANALMVYTGAPQNTKRKPIEELNVEGALELLKENNIPPENMIVHAPYIINLGNTQKEATFEIAVEFLGKEIERTEKIGAKYIVLHPGAHVGAGEELGMERIIEGLNLVLKEDQNVIVCLETMAGKGSEIGKTFEELSYIIENVDLPEKLGVCLDTCHIHDAGYDLTKFDEVLTEFDKVVGIEKLKVLHINDSKNVKGAAKDRHENIGYGEIGFDILTKIIYHPKLDNIVKILETPFHEDQPPYKKEIEMIKNKKFENWKN